MTTEQPAPDDTPPDTPNEKREVPTHEELTLKLVEISKIDTIVEDGSPDCHEHLLVPRCVKALRLGKVARHAAWTAPLMVAKRKERFAPVGRLRQAFFMKQFLPTNERVPVVLLRDDSSWTPYRSSEIDALLWLLIAPPSKSSQVYAAKLLNNPEMVGQLARPLKIHRGLIAELLEIDTKTAAAYAKQTPGASEFDEE